MEAKGATARTAKPSSLLDTRVIYCGDCLEQLRKLPEGCVELMERHLIEDQIGRIFD